MNYIKGFIKDEDAVGVVEIVLILVVLIGLVLIFKDELNDLIKSIFKRINSNANSV